MLSAVRRALLVLPLAAGCTVSPPAIHGPSIHGPSISTGSISPRGVTPPHINGPGISGPSISGPSAHLVLHCPVHGAVGDPSGSCPDCGRELVPGDERP